MAQTIEINLTVNGRSHRLKVRPEGTLLEVLRDELNLTGTKEGCGKGECGTCTVIMNGEAVNSCLILAPEAKGSEIITIEGLERDGQLDTIQKAFIEEGGIQCGFCTPGMILTAKAFLARNPDPSVNDIRAAISGNLCRCTGYAKIVKAIQRAAVGPS